MVKFYLKHIMAFFDQFKNTVSGMLDFNNKGDHVIGLDIGSSFIKVVQLRKENEVAVLETYGELALGPYAGGDVGGIASLDVGQVTQAIEALFEEANITTKVAAVAIPLPETLLSLIKVPSAPQKELEETISEEASKYIPVSTSDVTLDWWVIPEPEVDEQGETDQEQKELEVLIVAIHNDVLSKYNNIISQGELKQSSLEIEIFSAVRATASRDMSTFLVIDMGASTTKISVVGQGIIKTSHIVNTGSAHVSQAIAEAKGITSARAEEYKRKLGLEGTGDDEAISNAARPVVDQVLEEANRILLDYQKKYQRTITKAVLVGGGVLMPGFEARAGEKLATEVVYGEAFAKARTPKFLEPVFKEAGPEFSVAMGLALKKLEDLG